MYLYNCIHIKNRQNCATHHVVQYPLQNDLYFIFILFIITVIIEIIGSPGYN